MNDKKEITVESLRQEIALIFKDEFVASITETSESITLKFMNGKIFSVEITEK